MGNSNSIQSDIEITEQRTNQEHLKEKELNQKIELREKFARYSCYAVFGWLIFIALILTDYIFFWSMCDIKIFSDNVLIALIGGCSANIIGLFAIVLRSLFPSNK